jgi:hypothetical protein
MGCFEHRGSSSMALGAQGATPGHFFCLADPFFAIHPEASEWQPHCLDLSVIGLIDTKENSMQALWNRVSIGWCRAFHAAPSWPIHGHYHCPTCLRTYAVPWGEGNGFARPETSHRDPRGERPGFGVLEFQKNRV